MSSMFEAITATAANLHDAFAATWDAIAALPAPMLIGAALIIAGTVAITTHDHR